MLGFTGHPLGKKSIGGRVEVAMGVDAVEVVVVAAVVVLVGRGVVVVEVVVVVVDVVVVELVVGSPGILRSSQSTLRGQSHCQVSRLNQRSGGQLIATGLPNVHL